MDALLAPFFTVLEKSTDRVMVSKVKAGVFERLLESGSQLLETVKKGDEMEKGSAEEKLGKIGLLFGFSKRFLDIGAKAETVQSNRKVVFGLRDAFVKIEKGLQLSGLEITVPKFEATEVPVPPNAGEEKAQKKKKKAKKAALAEGEMEEAKDLKREKKGKKDKKEKKEKKKRGSTGAPVDDQQMGDGTDGITFDETLKSNLQKQFEMAAAEAGMPKGGSSSGASPVTPASGKVARKRKRSKSADKLSEASYGDDGSKVFEAATFGYSKGKRTKKGAQPGPIAPTPIEEG
ncbi:unnamed protein product [Miscanthus lutarioriparius]|uniref:Uncharacterized protein n=1 Tax=Miscanthus lutarioriparius TaxID=422564 RepID=A0A811QZI9_9POAL|nr:unnamed protein product [Miscanthus lutarioriparius]